MAGIDVGKLEEKGINKGLDLAESGGKAAFNSALDFAKDESRKVQVKITNNTKQKWSSPRLFLDCGMTEDLLPLTIDDEKDVTYEIHKKKWTFSGIGGAISYQWKVDQKTYYFVVMFRSPTVGRNTWNAVIYDSETEASQRQFSTLCQERGQYPPVRGDANYTTREFGAFTMQAAMSSSGTAKLHVTISCTEQEELQQHEE